MDGIIRFAQSFISSSTQEYENRVTKKQAVKWKYCIALERAGYVAKCDTVENSRDLVFTWRKENIKDIKIKLSFTEQQLWLDYLERRSAKERGNGEE